MDRINGLCDELLIKILSFAPTKVAISASILSKRWEFLWMWVPELEYDYYSDITTVANRGSESSRLRYRDFIKKYLPLHRAPVIESLRLRFCIGLVQPEDIELWVGIALLKVTYLNEDSLGLLPSFFPVLEDLVIERHGHDNVKAVVVTVPSLQRLSLWIDGRCSSDGFVIDTPALNYFKVEDHRGLSYLIKHMPKLEEAFIAVGRGLDEFLELITPVKRLSLQVFLNNEDESEYSDGIVFHQLEHLKLTICEDYWSKLLVRLLSDSPKLRVLNLDVHVNASDFDNYERTNWSNELSFTPECLLKSLETFEFEGYEGRPEERDFLSLLFLKARRLKSTSIFRSSSESESE
ncbi:unnamed protein product [Microthlaspi erraticum]|uniref:Uncharacterized protein n=1 Tax=Microthlaspi erraticum TaxID=1685480 RepID=A0A6D2HI73_9BRAS|nr:unnamed protein product [Microthlaspi erraticum]